MKAEMKSAWRACGACLVPCAWCFVEPRLTSRPAQGSLHKARGTKNKARRAAAKLVQAEALGEGGDGFVEPLLALSVAGGGWNPLLPWRVGGACIARVMPSA